MSWYLLFDGNCSGCRKLATTVKGSSTQVETISIHSTQAMDLLNRLYPNGWKHIPYLLSVEQDKVRAWTGIGLAIRLVQVIGFQGALQVWTGLRKNKTSLLTVTERPLIDGMRRRILKTSFGVTFAALIAKFLGVSFIEPKTAHAAFCPWSLCGCVGYVTGEYIFCACLSTACTHCACGDCDEIHDITCYFTCCGYRTGTIVVCNECT